MHYQSTLSTITDQVWSATTATSAKNIIIDHLKATRVNDRDAMIAHVSKLTTLPSIQRYFANALLAFEGMRTSIKKEI